MPDKPDKDPTERKPNRRKIFITAIISLTSVLIIAVLCIALFYFLYKRGFFLPKYITWNNQSDTFTIDNKTVDFKLSKKKLVSNTAFYFTFLWKIHPFREGNTRTVSTMMSLYAKKIGLKLDVDFVAEHVKYFRNAMVLNSIGEYAEPEHLEEFLSDALLIRNPKDSTEKYKTINGYEVEKYRYAQHSSKD